MEERLNFNSKLKTTFAAIALIGLILGLAGIFFQDVSAYRIWGTILTTNIYFVLIAFAGMFLMALQYVTNAGWSAGFRRIFEAMGSYLYVGLIFTALILFFGLDAIYHHWSDPALLDPDSPKYDPIIVGKSTWLNAPFFYIRFFLVAVAILPFVYLFRKWSLKEDEIGGFTMHKKIRRYSNVFLIVFALFFSIAAFDWLMSIDSHWYSTIYSVYVFSGAMVIGTVTLILTLRYLQSQGQMSIIKTGHFHDLGKFTFGFSIFWMYIWVAQFLLIWYSNQPETTVYYAQRLSIGEFAGRNYENLFFANIIINFAIPFLVLISRGAKRNLQILTGVCILLIAGRFIDLHLLVQPGVTEAPLAFGLPEIGFFLFFGGVFLYTMFYTLSRANLVAVNHPHLKEAEHHEVHP